MRIKTVLAPTDFSANAQHAFVVAHELARLAGASLCAVHAAESPLRVAVNENIPMEGLSQEEIQEAVDGLLRSRFAAMISGIGPGVEIRTATISGNPHIAMPEFARQQQADLIVVGMQGQSALYAMRSALLGSVANTILQNSPCPVVVVRLDHKC